MATYKVLQDIEAEDKLIGPLTLRQFIYAFISVGCLYVSFLLLTKGVPYMLIVSLPIAGMSGFFAWPWRGDQPTEIWALAKIRFLVKPRRRIWDQSGIKELVSITVPKKVEVNYTNGLSETEVKSRLHALADTIDSRGWAIKNVGLNSFGQQPLVMSEPSSDRLLSPQDFPQEVPATDIQPGDDMLDEQNNPVAHQFDTMITASSKAHRQKILAELQGSLRPQNIPVTPRAGSTSQQQPAQSTPPPRPAQTGQPGQPQQPANDYWFMNQPTPGSDQSTGPDPGAVTFNTQVVSPGVPAPPGPVSATPTADETALVQQLKAQAKADHISYSHLHTIQPLSAQKPKAQPRPKVTQPSDAAILNLARNDDLNVATIAREAHKQRPEPPQEVVISLH